jgi:hypothetical protein
MRLKSIFDKMALSVLVFILFVFLACGGGSAVKSEPVASKEPAVTPSAEGSKETPLGKKYDRIIFQKFEYDPQIEVDYPGAVAECEKSTLESVTAKKIFASATMAIATAEHAGALLVKAKVTNLRIVSTGARMWGGAFAGSSEMSLQMKLIDASSGTVVREKDLSTNNNPWAASWTGGSSDRSLPTDLGKMVAEYLVSIQPQKITETAEKKIAESSASKQMSEVKEQTKPIQASSENLPSAAQAVKTLEIVKTASIRSGPNTKSKILATLKKGTKVEYLGKSGNWFNVKLSTGVTGWVFENLVTEKK